MNDEILRYLKALKVELGGVVYVRLREMAVELLSENDRLRKAVALLDPELTTADADAELREIGIESVGGFAIDPVEVGERGSALANALLENRRLKSLIAASSWHALDMERREHDKTKVRVAGETEALKSQLAIEVARCLQVQAQLSTLQREAKCAVAVLEESGRHQMARRLRDAYSLTGEEAAELATNRDTFDPSMVRELLARAQAAAEALRMRAGFLEKACADLRESEREVADER